MVSAHGNSDDTRHPALSDTLSIAELMAANADVTRQPKRYVRCPLDPSHRMPEHRLQWHLLNRCKMASEAKDSGLLWHCPYDWLHCGLGGQVELNLHVQGCARRV